MLFSIDFRTGCPILFSRSFGEKRVGFLTLPVWVGHSCPTNLSNLHSPDVHPSQTTPWDKSKIKGFGQECPSHTCLCTPNASLSPECTITDACYRIIRKQDEHCS